MEKSSAKKIYLGLAALLVAAAFVAYWAFGAGGPSAREVALAEAEALPPLAEKRGVSSARPPIPSPYFQQIRQWIVSGEPDTIQQALARLEQVSPQDPGYLWVKYLQGAAHFRLEQYEPAAFSFKQVAEDRSASTENRQAAEYYQLLSLMLSGREKAEFLPLLSRIKEQGAGHAYYQRVLEVEERLSK